VTNPAVIYQQDTIILQDSDVYYAPYAPPVSTDTREQLCCIAKELADLDGVTDYYSYDPKTNGHSITSLYGDTATWMRLFQAARKPDGTKTAIITQRSVTVSKNEDVDFRASGSIRLNSGFHVKPGAHFHAYIEPQFDSVIFSDEFDHSGLSKWAVFDSIKSDANCYIASQAIPNQTVTGALDSKALAMNLDEDSSSGSAGQLSLIPDSTCLGWLPVCSIIQDRNDLTCVMKGTVRKAFKAAQIESCPWPFISADSTPLRPVSQKLPYGKYEIRDKLPIALYHSNSYAADAFDELNLGEMEIMDSSRVMPGLAHRRRWGPFRGKFGTRFGSIPTFRSATANFCLANLPTRIIVDNFPYSVSSLFYDHPPGGGFDTCLGFDATTLLKGIPSSLMGGDSATFYYERAEFNVTDTLPWSVDSTGRYFTGVYQITRDGDTLRFNKEYQPSHIILFPPPINLGSTDCHWDNATGKIWLDNPLSPGFPHSGVSSYLYSCREGCAYPQPQVHIQSGEWHTWAVELLPHECRFLMDGRVVRRIPDRLIPRTDSRSDFVSNYPRMLTPLILQFELDGGDRYNREKSDFENTFGTHTARTIDYIKFWELPGEYTIPIFPN
jgi:hypothetical protein